VLEGKRPRFRRVLSDPSASVVVVEHRDRLARFGVEPVEAALWARGRRSVVTGEGGSEDGVVREMIEVPTWLCARLYGRRGAWNRAVRAVTAAKRDGPGTGAP
jgi:putative resolvase